MTIQAIEHQALSLGFDAVGFAAAHLPASAGAGLREYLAAGHYGEMEWMVEKADRRADPKTLWPEAQSVIVLGHNYAPEENPLAKLSNKNIGNISCYALNQDYHEVIKKRLKQMARWLATTYGCEVKVFVDTAPVMEKPLAEMAGIGWVGKHTCVVSREFGSWLFLGSIFTTLPLGEGSGVRDRGSEKNEDFLPLIPDPRSPSPDHCGTCTACLDICPTQAFTAARQLDARKCISYLTIEHKGLIPHEYRKAIGNRIYGCDDCLAVCPWNKFAQTAQETAYHARESLKEPPLSALLTLDDMAFRALFNKSPVKRIGRDRFIRNVLIAAGNSGDITLAPLVAAHRDSPNEVVAEAADWALQELVCAA